MMAPMAASLKTPVASSLINAITGKGEIDFFHYYHCLRWWKFWEKKSQEQEEGIITWIKIFSSALFYKQYQDCWVFQLRA